MKSTKWLATMAAGAMLAAVPALPAAAQHGEHNDRTRITCTGPSAARATLRLRPRVKSKHHGTIVTKIIKMNFEVEGAAGASWNFSVDDNGTVLSSGTAVADATGEFETQKNAPDIDGVDDVFTAHADSGTDVCDISMTVPTA